MLFRKKAATDDFLMDKPPSNGRWLFKLILFLLLLIAVVAVFYYYSHKEDSALPQAAVPEQVQKNAVEEKPVIDPGNRLIAQVQILINSNELLQARERCYMVLERSNNQQAIKKAKSILSDINIQLLLTESSMPEKSEYLVRKGDSLGGIANTHSTTLDLLKTNNNLTSDVIHPGDYLRVFNGEFSIKVDKSENKLVVYMNDRFFKEYDIGTGKHGSTPQGKFVISDKIKEPPWWKPGGGAIPFGDPENVLGTRWMSIQAVEGTPQVRGYGIHGTWEPETIGGQTSRGCIRMLNKDVEELFLLVPLGTEVKINE
jgi:LysM repeat protein